MSPLNVEARAPGRVNLIGEHTDYNGGFVLPMAIPQHTHVTLQRRDDDQVHAGSANVAANVEQGSYRLEEETPGRGWLDYVQGVTRVLREQGHGLHGFDVHIRSNVPLGSGLSSSAALEVALLRGLRELFELSLDDVALALVGQRVETEFVGAPVGVMDPLACSLADEKTALFLDTRSLRWERIPLPPSLQLVVIDSGLTHSHASGEYRLRRAECERAASLLGVGLLRELSETDLPRILALPEPLGRRVRHVMTENARVLAAVDALRSGNGKALGQLFVASHASMRDDYAVSTQELDLLVALAVEEAEVFGARLTGGGFGGSIVAMAQAGTGARAGARIAARYAERTGRKPQVLVPPVDSTSP